VKPRPPTLREPRRYLLVRLLPGIPTNEGKVIASAIEEALSSLFGDQVAARVHPAVISVAGDHAIIRCRRGGEQILETALATVFSAGDHAIALRPVSTSGTVRSLKEKIPSPEKAAWDTADAEVLFNGERARIARRTGRSIDLIGKGLTNTELFFVTEEDIEEI